MLGLLFSSLDILKNSRPIPEKICTDICAMHSLARTAVYNIMINVKTSIFILFQLYSKQYCAPVGRGLLLSLNKLDIYIFIYFSLGDRAIRSLTRLPLVSFPLHPDYLTEIFVEFPLNIGHAIQYMSQQQPYIVFAVLLIYMAAREVIPKITLPCYAVTCPVVQLKTLPPPARRPRFKAPTLLTPLLSAAFLHF